VSLTVVEAELLRIWDERGELSPSAVVESATAADSPLHGRFEWSDGEAARKYRLGQARDLIRSVKLTVVRQEPDGTGDVWKVRQWVSGQQAEEPGVPPGGYIPARDVSSPSRTVLLQRMQREMHALRRRYGGLSEFWSQLDRLRDEAEDKAV
jgi:hypothetical protein